MTDDLEAQARAESEALRPLYDVRDAMARGEPYYPEPDAAPASVGQQWKQYRRHDGSLVLVRWDQDIEAGWVPMPATETP